MSSCQTELFKPEHCLCTYTLHVQHTSCNFYCTSNTVVTQPVTVSQHGISILWWLMCSKYAFVFRVTLNAGFAAHLSPVLFTFRSGSNVISKLTHTCWHMINTMRINKISRNFHPSNMDYSESNVCCIIRWTEEAKSSKT